MNKKVQKTIVYVLIGIMLLSALGTVILNFF